MKYLLPILFIITLVSCKPSTQRQESKTPYFEGFVEFKVIYSPGNPKFTSMLKRGVGTRTVTYIGANGFFCREYIDSNNIILNREIFRPDSLRFYEMPAKSDTVYSADVTRSSEGAVYLGIDKNSTNTILGDKVEEVKAKTNIPNGMGATLYVYTTYYNDKKFPIDPLTYKHAVYEGIEDMFSHSPYLTAGINFKYSNNAMVTYIATRIAATHIPAWHFDIPKNKIIVYQN